MKNLRNMLLERTSSAIMWSVIVEAILLVVFLLMDVKILHPIVWFQSLIPRSLSFGTWIYFIPLSAILLAHCIVMYNEHLVTVSPFCGTRFTRIQHLFSLHNLFSATLYALLSGTITWVYLSVHGGEYDSLTGSCKFSKSTPCLVEGHFFLIMSGFWSGSYYFLSNYISGCKTVTFPVVQQLKFLQIKSVLFQFLKQAMFSAVWPSLIFPLLYFWKGVGLQEHLSDFLGVVVEGKHFNTIIDFVILLPYSWTLCTIFIFTILITKYLFQVYLTEHHLFPVMTKFGDSSTTTLREAMAMTDMPIIQSLGYFDLMYLAEKDYLRRQELFTLSVPGGHPYNWNSVVMECLKLINTFTANLEASVEPNVVKNLPTPTAPIALRHSRAVLHGVRNLSMPRIDAISYQEVQQANVMSPTITYELITSRAKLLVDNFLKKPGFCYVFGEIPDAKLRHVLSQGWPVIWATQGIALLVSASLKEDSYGVVLKDLPVVISSLLQLKQVLEKIPKAGNYKRSHKNEHYEMKLKVALRASVKRSLYRICITFGDSIKELDLPKNSLQQLQMYLSFRES